MRRISIYFLIIFCTIIKAQDDLVLVKLQNGKNVKGIIVKGGGPGDYYVRIKKRNQKTVDIYMKDIKHIYKGTGSLTIQISNEKGDPVEAVIAVQDLDSRNAESIELKETSYDDFLIGNYKITVQKEGYNSESKRLGVILGDDYFLTFELTPVETRIEPAKKQVEVTDNTSGKYSVPSKTLKKVTAVSSLIFGISSAYFHYSSVRNYKLYQKSRNGNDVPKLREKVESADQLKITSLIISSISFIIHRYMKNKQNIIDKSYSD